MVKIEISEEEKAEKEKIRIENRKASVARAKKKYMNTEKGKSTAKKYYQNNQDFLLKKQRIYRVDIKDKVDQFDLLKDFYEKFKDQHEDYKYI